MNVPNTKSRDRIVRSPLSLASYVVQIEFVVHDGSH